jgi:hypothetical protein
VRVRHLAMVFVVGLAAAGSGLAEQRPVAVSPGNATGSLIGSTCPTFSWGEVEGAKSYEVVVYRFVGEAEEPLPVLRGSFAGSVYGWTPALDQCLERGGSYAWSVRATGAEGASNWSAPSLFEVAAPTVGEFQEALQIVRDYLAVQDVDARGPADVALAEARAEPEGERPVSDATPDPRAGAPTALRVDQAVEAASFRGDGSSLTNLDASSLASGQVAGPRGGTGLDASTLASGSLLQVGGGGGWSPLGPGQDGQVLKVAGAGTLAWGPDQDTDTTCLEGGVVCNFAASSSEGGAATMAESGDSAAGFFSQGHIEEPRIADEIARDVELRSLFLALKRCVIDGWRYSDMSDGTVLDCNTGKLWLKDASCLGTAPWPQALVDVGALASGSCGLTDGSSAGEWRLPTAREICSAFAGMNVQPCPAGAAFDSLIDSSLPDGAPNVQNARGTGPWSEGDAFVGIGPGYWSSTEMDTDHAWATALWGGTIIPGEKVAFLGVWAVRAEPGQGAVCGDGLVDAPEICDDNNTDSCGTCSADCLTSQAGGDCPPGSGCAAHIDCLSGSCLDGLCE